VKVHFNGRLMDAAEARIGPTDRGLTLGDGLYETIAVRAGRAARLEAHLARLRDGAAEIGIAVAPSERELAAALAEVIEANGIDEGVLRLTLTRGPGPRGLAPPVPAQPSLVIAGWAREPGLGSGAPATAIVATVTRRNAHSPLARIKSTNCLDNVLAHREARSRGADDALLLNGAGNIAEATVANLFAVIKGDLVTPPVPDGALPGVMRADVVRELAAAERTVTPRDLAGAAEAFLTNSLGIRPLVAVDGAAVGDGAPGPAFGKAREIVRGA